MVVQDGRFEPGAKRGAGRWPERMGSIGAPELDANTIEHLGGACVPRAHADLCIGI
jgi:hypothetical protein